MKKLILFAAILFAGVSVVKAQGEGEVLPTTAIEGQTANLTVKLNKIQTIQVIGTDVTLEYKTMDNYIKGVSKYMNGHLKVFSAGNYDVKVASTSANLSNDSKTGMGSSTIKVRLSDLDENSGKALSTTETLLFSGKNSLVEGNTFNITYDGAGDYAYLPFFNDGDEGENLPTSYSVNVVYTITPQ